MCIIQYRAVFLFDSQTHCLLQQRHRLVILLYFKKIRKYEPLVAVGVAEAAAAAEAVAAAEEAAVRDG